MAGSRPSAETLRWVERSIGRQARVVRGRRMMGGVASSIDLLTVETKAGRRTFVLRRWAPETAEPGPRFARAVAREAAVLTALERTPLPVPRLVAFDGERGALLMTRVPGHVHLAPADLDRWIRQIAEVLPRIHGTPAVDAVPLVVRRRPGKLEVPGWSRRAEVRRRAIDLLRDARPASDEACFIHGDFQHFNLLWSRERLTGIVDWTMSAKGPPDLDVGHCRLNLAVLFAPEVAERFRLAYQAEAGREMDPWWDVRALMAYDETWKRFIPLQVHRRAPVDVAGMDDRVDALLERALARA